jgi:hypothetical protein
MKGSDFAGSIRDLNGHARELAALHVSDSWMTWPMERVAFQGKFHEGAIFVTADVFAIGTPEDFLRMPLSPLTAQRIADLRGWMFPTQKMSDLIVRAATRRVAPMPGTAWAAHAPQPHPGWGGDSNAGGGKAMLSSAWIEQHNTVIEEQLAAVSTSDGLVAGHKKDIVLTNRLEAKDPVTGHGGPEQVAIYGWHQLNGVAIQPLSCIHENTYADYSHGFRGIALDAELDGAPITVQELLTDPDYAELLSYEGVLRVLRQPGVSPAT